MTNIPPHDDPRWLRFLEWIESDDDEECTAEELKSLYGIDVEATQQRVLKAVREAWWQKAIAEVAVEEARQEIWPPGELPERLRDPMVIIRMVEARRKEASQ